MSPKTSWKDVIAERQKESFVGRKDYIKQFTDNFASDIPNYLLLFVIGEGGVGKSTLLKQFESVGKDPEIDAIVITCDDEQSSPVSAMGHIAEQLAKYDISSKEFNERYKTYRTRRDEIESDPKAPRGALNLVVRGMTDFAIKAARRAPGIGVFAEYVDEKEAGDALTQGVNYLVDRIGNKDEVQLLREPEKNLTPLFNELLNKACKEHRLVLMFDVFERTREALEPWLLEFLDFKFGEFDTGVTFVISGRDAVDQRWTQIASSICYITLEPFTFEETRSCLRFRKITNKQLVTQIFEDTGGLPVLVELLAGTNPKPGIPLPDISKDAVKRFLQWIPEEERRWVALLAAIPRKFNLDILSATLDKDAHNDFNWLSVQSYIRTSTVRGWFYHEKVRELMLKYLRNTNPSELAAAHAKLAKFFETQQKNLELKDRAAYASDSWREFEIERIYHYFSEQPNINIKVVMNAFLWAYRWRLRFAGSIVQICQQVSHEIGLNEIQQNAQILSKFHQSYEKNKYEEFITQANLISNRPDLDAVAKAALLNRRGEAFLAINNTEMALADLNEAIILDDKYVLAYINRGRIYRQINSYDNALLDFDQAITLEKNRASAFAGRGYTYQLMSKYEEALKDFNLAISLDEKYFWAISNRGTIHQLLGKYEEALTDFNSLIQVNEKNLWAIASRGLVLHQLHRNEEALASLSEAISHDYQKAFLLELRGRVYEEMDLLDQAMIDFDLAIDADHEYIRAYESKGRILIQKGEYDLALLAYDAVLKINDQRHHSYEQKGIVLRQLRRLEEAVEALTKAEETYNLCPACVAERGEIMLEMGKHENALADFNRAIEINNTMDIAFADRGETYRQIGRLEEALIDFNRAIELDEKYAWAIASRGLTLNQMGRYKEALADLNQAISLDGKNDSIIAMRGDFYENNGRLEEALSDYNKAIAINNKNAIALADRGWAYFQLGKYEMSLADFNLAIDLDSEFHWAYEKRGITLRVLGFYEDAIASLDMAEKTSQNCDACIIERGRTYLQIKKHEEALKDFNHALDMDKENYWCYYQRFLAYFETGQDDKRKENLATAIQLATKIYENDPDNEANICNLALFYLADGKIDQSETLFHEVLSADITQKLIRECIDDLNDYSRFVQDTFQANKMRILFEEKLKELQQP